MLDFNKLVSERKINKSADPIEIYKFLDRKSDTGELRPIQEKILKKWYEEKKDSNNQIIKLGTGAGKTLIGLLILQSRINSNDGPCLYVCPNNYLVAQVCNEAKKFGIQICVFDSLNNDIPDEYLEGKKILICSAQKVFNGLSVFENNPNSIPGTLLLDDSHACIEVIKNAFTITINKTEDAELFSSLIELFDNDLSKQREGSFMDLKNGESSIIMPVPYWSWFENKSKVLSLLSEAKTSSASVRFTWPLIRDNIDDFCCYFSNYRIQISPYNLNVNKFSFYCNTQHKVLMSATTQDDSFFITGFGFDPNDVENPLSESEHQWSGEKMIIIPSLINNECDRNIVVNNIFTHCFSNNFGKVVIVPNTNSTKIYESLGGCISNSNNINEYIDKIKANDFSSFVVLNNRYDGIDLPDDCCRLLVLDSLPSFSSLADQYELQCLKNSELIEKRIAQRIEQGLGRGVRGEKDYCAIILIGADLINFIKGSKTKRYFSSQTQKQIEIGLTIANADKRKEKDNIMEPIYSLIEQLISRDDGWKLYYSESMNSLQSNSKSTNMHNRLKMEYNFYNEFAKRNYIKACDKLQKYIDEECSTQLEKGWYLQILARFKMYVSRSESIELQKSAFNLNNNLLKPQVEIDYKRLQLLNGTRIESIRHQLETYLSLNNEDFILEWTKLLDDFSFGKDSELFESAVDEIGRLLGFSCQRPDKELGKGPDNLWCIRNNLFFIIECKNEVEEGRRSIKKEEAGQMNNHIGWFKEVYGNNVKYFAFEIIPTKLLAYEANFVDNVRIIRKSSLEKLKKSLQSFIMEINKFELDSITDSTIQNALDICKLNEEDFINLYSENYVTSSK